MPNSRGNSEEVPASVGRSVKASSCLECCDFSSGFGWKVFHPVWNTGKFCDYGTPLYYLDLEETHDYLRDSFVLAEMAAQGSSSGPGAGGIPLHEFRKDVPPGWAPNISDYPLRLYFERLKLWYRIYEGDDTMVGPLVAGRLQGKAQRLGMQLRLPRPDGGVDVGSDALIRLSVEEVRDPQNQNIVLQHSIPSGIQALCNSLKDAFGVSDQEMVSQSIEAFFEFRRGKMSFQEYAIEFDIRLEEAVTRAGLDLNDVAKFYLFFRGSGLPYKFVEDIKLQLQGDLRRYQEARVLALRLITKKDDSGELYYEEAEPNNFVDDGWESNSWTDEGWSWVEDTSPSHHADYWQDGDYHNELYHDGAYYYDEDYDAWYDGGSWDAEPQGDPETASTADAENEVSENYPMKGKSGKGPGCSICGSRWHASSSCPVGANSSYGGGKGKGKPKGFGAPSGGKGKFRKGAGKGKSKGKGKWTPRGKGKGYFGYATEKTLVGSFGESRASMTPPKTKVVHFKLDHDESPVLNLGSRLRHQEADADEAEAASSSVTKTLDFSFMTGVFSDSLSYHTVLGVKRRGLLVDPGAASGLVGSETLRDLMEHCLPENKEQAVQWRYDRTNSVSGINGTPEQTLGEVSLPLKMSDMSGTYSAEVIGGEGSLCPALLSNPALRKQSSALLTNHFENGDGVLVARQGKDDWSYIRVLLTDSGHYLLPVDGHEIMTKNEQKAAEQMLFTWSEEIQSRWSDVRHCFLQRREHERSYASRSEPKDASASSKTFSTTTEAYIHEAANRCTTSRTSSTTTEIEAHEPEDASSSPKTFSTTTERTVPRARNDHSSDDTTATSGSMASFEAKDAGSSSETFSTTTEVVLFKNLSSASGSFTTKSSASGSTLKPFLDGPSIKTTAPQDYWTSNGDYLFRHHKVARRILFTPNCSVDCPVEATRFTGERTTEIHYVPKNAAARFLEDDWVKAKVPNYDLGSSWVGVTKFKLRPAPSPPQPPAAMATESGDVGLEGELFPAYSGDQFPSHWSAEKKERAKRYYRSIPEEFYSKSGRRPITPDNVLAWMRRAKGKSLRFQFWELFSGSGRLSLCMMMAQIMVGFPVDHRYAWDIGYAPHQSLLQQVHHEFVPDHVFAAPSCAPWSVASASKDKAKREEDRRAEFPTLEFLHDLALSQHNQDRGFTLEQPYSSAMLRDSPVAKLLNHAGVRIQRMDQCMLGATDEQQRPIRKATALLSNRRWRRALKRCDGHKGLPHGELQGRFKGCCRTAMAAVYPKRMTQLLSQDLRAILRADHASICSQWPRSLFWQHGIYYNCERCQLGRAAPPGCDHTMVPGECRFGQPSMRQARARRDAPPPAPTTTTPEMPVQEPDSPAAPSSASAAAPASRLARSDLEDITGPFKFLARSGDYSRVSLRVHPSLTIQQENQLYLKAAMMQLIESCLDVFKATTATDYDHWLSDPVLLRVFQDVFQDILSVLGVLVSLRPWQRKVPDPYLSSACAPMRLLISGEIRSWEVHGLEDMRVLSHSQLHARVEEADWHVHLFGFCQDDMEVDRVSPGSASAASRPSAVPDEKENGGRAVSSSSSLRPAAASPQAPQPPAADTTEEMEGDARDEEDFDAVRPEAEEETKTLKPLFDFKKVYKRLQSDIIQNDPTTAKRLLLGLHERFYHCPITDFKNMLLRAGLSSDVLPLAEEAVMSCSICRKYVRLPNRPQVKIGSAASSFNHRVQIDLFMHKENWILLNIDEATRYKTATAVKSREHQELLNCMFDSWFSVFGPPAQLVMDQETSLMSHEAGRELERFNVERVPKGTTAGPAGKQHTGTGLVERHVGLMEITMLKLEAELDRQGIVITVGDLVAKEAAMSHNISLNYGGATPSMCVFGVIPRPFYQTDESGVTAITGALQNGRDAL